MVRVRFNSNVLCCGRPRSLSECTTAGHSSGRQHSLDALLVGAVLEDELFEVHEGALVLDVLPACQTG